MTVAEGEVVLDINVDREGVVQEVEGAFVWLRPRSGGREWQAKLEDIRKVGDQ